MEGAEGAGLGDIAGLQGRVQTGDPVDVQQQLVAGADAAVVAVPHVIDIAFGSTVGTVADGLVLATLDVGVVGHAVAVHQLVHVGQGGIAGIQGAQGGVRVLLPVVQVGLAVIRGRIQRNAGNDGTEGHSGQGEGKEYLFHNGLSFRI